MLSQYIILFLSATTLATALALPFPSIPTILRLIAAVPRVSADAPACNLRIMPIGASITAGTSGGGKITAGYRKPLRDKLVARGCQVDMVGTQSNGDFDDNQHEGYPGIRTQQLADQTLSKKPIDASKPNLLLLNVGTNDCTAKLSREDARKAYSNMIDAVFAPQYSSSSNTTEQFLIVSTLLPRRSGDEGQNECVNYFGDVIRDLAKTHAKADRIALADMNKGDGKGPLTVDDLAQGDNLHPSAAGFDKMAQVWLDATVQIMGKINQPVSTQ